MTSEFEFEMKTCYACKQEKIKVIFFHPASNLCTDCKRALNKKKKVEGGTDPKMGWKQTGMHIKSSNKY